MFCWLRIQLFANTAVCSHRSIRNYSCATDVVRNTLEGPNAKAESLWPSFVIRMAKGCLCHHL